MFVLVSDSKLCLFLCRCTSLSNFRTLLHKYRPINYLIVEQPEIIKVPLSTECLCTSRVDFRTLSQTYIGKYNFRLFLTFVKYEYIVWSNK